VGDEVGTPEVERVEEGQQVAEPGVAVDVRVVGDRPPGTTQVGRTTGSPSPMAATWVRRPGVSTTRCSKPGASGSGGDQADASGREIWRSVVVMATPS
jgi:hypothetical protein